MIKKLSIVILVIFFSFSFGQKKNAPPPPEISNSSINKDFKPETFNSRIKNFPFNKTSKTKVISYNLEFKKEPIHSYIPIEDSIAIKNYNNRKIPTKLSDILAAENLYGIQQQKSLNLIEIQDLSNIIFNECDKYSTGIISSSGCYFPRNAILFYDENDKIFAYFEICFQCGGFESYPKKLFEEEMRCESIYSMLESFFNKLGIKTQYSEENNEKK